jgi:signal transduction histidine kinase
MTVPTQQSSQQAMIVSPSGVSDAVEVAPDITETLPVTTSTFSGPTALKALRRTWRKGQRRRTGSRHGLLRRLPIYVAIGSLIVSTILAVAAMNRFSKADRDKRWLRMERELIDQSGRTLATLAGGPPVEHGWIINPSEKTSTKFEKGLPIDPPVFQFAEGAKDGPRFEYFGFGGWAFWTYTRPVDGKLWTLNVADLGWVKQQNSMYVRAIRYNAIALVLLTSLLLGLLTRFLTQPTRRVLAERADFFADAAHEMRTPLAVIRASATHALVRGRSTEEYVQSLAEISAAAERASLGVTELLDLARFDAGQALPRLAPLRLDLLAEELAATTRVEQCEVIAEVGPSALVQADLILLRQALDNLVRNAASRADHVVLRTQIVGREVELSVTDDGPGFAPEQLPYVFERYRRGDSRGSLGLGLPIAASIVAAHGGTISVESPVGGERLSGPNPGAIVRIRLPRSRPQ